MKAPRERPHRLPPERYRGKTLVAFTTCLEDRHPLFLDPRRADEFARVLIEETARHDAVLLLACFMPDHVHVLLQGRSDAADPLAAFVRFKLRTGVRLDRFCRPTHWQKDFYDHIVRCDRDWRGQARYVALNPVRAGLVEDPFDYPLVFSSLDTRQEVLAQIFWDG